MSLPGASTSSVSAAKEVAELVDAVDAEVVELPPAWKFRPTVGIGILAIIATVAALYLARAFFVPLLIGILASYALRPLVDRLKSWYVPRAIGAALVLGALIAGASWAAMSLGEDAAAMIEKLPEAAYKVRQRVIASRAAGPSTLQKIQDAAMEFQAPAHLLARRQAYEAAA